MSSMKDNSNPTLIIQFQLPKPAAGLFILKTPESYSMRPVGM